MRYRPFGTTGEKISALGFGAMRLPHRRTDTGEELDADQAIAMIHRALELGVNYLDTAYMYCGGHSERVVGRAIADRRDRVLLATKLPLMRVESRADFRRLLDEQLGKLATEHIDFYHFHGLDAKKWQEKVLAFDLLDEMDRARRAGLIRFASFSFHDEPAVMRTFIDSGAFASVLCQYNFLDRANAESMAYAHEQGLGVVVMGPVGGGRLGHPLEYLQEAVGRPTSTPELALRFVLANPAVDCALSGMSSMRHVEENAAVAADAGPLTAAADAAIATALAERKRLAELYCTGCAYCMPCPHEVNIPVCFECMIDHTVYGFTDRAIERYRAIGDKWLPGKRADACTGCGVCEEQCPQHIPIREQLAAVANTFAPLP
ncbi:MAG: aldo/keto reductase [Planctomycetota bacterium]